MNNSDWNIIFKLNEFSNYFSGKGLIQLSMSSKKSRNLLAKDIFKTLNLRSFICDKDYSSLFIKEISQNYSKYNIFINPFKPLSSELIESKIKFINDLKKFNRVLKSLVVNECVRYHYLLNEIPYISSNITTLIFKNSHFRLDTFQYLLDNFKCLEKLELFENTILHNAEISNEYTVKYPISLRSLILYENNVMMISDKVSSISIHEYCIGKETYNLIVTYQYLPNLVTFGHDMELSNSNEKEIFNFINLNPQLKSLILIGLYFIESLFYIIKDYENIISLEIDCENCIDGHDPEEIPVLHNIKYLHVKYFNCIGYIIKDKFPNLTDLVIYDDCGINNENNEIIESFL
ncbi:hypothetical protein CONCODRAFT_170984 [Conidiobolus coronatus NRRL 28638]|uniref:F-box domain-containing protein n=1 Tax=Conidiobolus coronatus (strain ATCC 28846 / CBS 209.66 / NRRL 28638) TaxID=796925 RepID=A0A137NPD8_CONC2|nr:hypothetical protein CONCODRAFT_170984 [Conidiobolus coronatus NRRL 28638]|eukprot:KXN64609.1 hypothetical protein CONCODRAFT_170984 [Conidiobolus coronatus NRRL 28638]